MSSNILQENNSKKIENQNNNTDNSSETKNNESFQTIIKKEGGIELQAPSENNSEYYKNIKNIIGSFFNYQIDNLRSISRIERDYKAIGEKYIKRLPFDYKERIDKLKQATSLNYSFLVNIVSSYTGLFKLYKYPSGEVFLEKLFVPANNIIQIRSTLRLFVRDWSKEGIEERNATHKPILEELQSFFKNRSKKDFENGINVLVPGSGLGRLVYEIAKLGFKSQGSEISLYMLLCFSYLLNKSTKVEEFTIQPFIHTLSNLFNVESAFKKIKIPDENIKEELSKTDTGKITMSSGDFCLSFQNKSNLFDSVVTCFFIDTANNIVEYIETIHNILKVGGLWINVGPLLYHHTDSYNEISIELAWNEIKEIVIGYGFEFTKEKRIETTYSTDKDSMVERVYKCIFFCAVKKK